MSETPINGMPTFDPTKVVCRKCKKTAAENKQKYCGDGSDKDNGHHWEKVALPPDPTASQSADRPEKCPRCGEPLYEAWRWTRGNWKCGSHIPCEGEFTQTSDCLISEREQQLAEVTADNAELREERDQLVSYQKLMEMEKAEVTAKANARLCASCMEQHPIDSQCPPHEMRTTGPEWFRERIAEVTAELDELTADRDEWKRKAYGQVTRAEQAESLLDQCDTLKLPNGKTVHRFLDDDDVYWFWGGVKTPCYRTAAEAIAALS